MNSMKHKTKSILACSLVALTAATAVVPAFAVQNSTGSVVEDLNNETNGQTDSIIGQDESQGQRSAYMKSNETSVGTNSTDVYVSQGSTYTVTLPKTVILDGKTAESNNGIYKVSVDGDISGDEIINVTPKSNNKHINSSHTGDTTTENGTTTCANITDENVQFYLGQKNKDDILANVSQNKTAFTTVDLQSKDSETPTNTTTGEISVSKLTAGSWKGQFSFNITMQQKYVYYTTIENALIDANNLTTENADVKRNDIANAEAGLYIDNGIAYVYLFKDANVETHQPVTVPINIDLGGKTLSASTTNNYNFTFSKVASITNGSMNLNDKGISLFSNNGLSLSNLNINITDVSAGTANVYGIRNNASDFIIENCDINLVGNTEQQLRSIYNAAKNGQTKLIDSKIQTSNKGISYGYIVLADNNTVTCTNSYVSAISDHGNTYGIYFNGETQDRAKRITATITKCETYAVNKAINKSAIALNLVNANTSIDGVTASIKGSIITPKTSTDLAVSDFSFANNNFDAKGAGIQASNSDLTIKDNKANVYVYGGNTGLTVNGDSNTKLYGGDYSSPEHGGVYIYGSESSPYNDATFEATNCTFRNSMKTDYNYTGTSNPTFGTDNEVYGIIAFGGFYAYTDCNSITLTDCNIVGGFNGFRLKWHDAGNCNAILNNTKISADCYSLNNDAGTITLNKGTTLKSGKADFMKEYDHNPIYVDNR